MNSTSFMMSMGYYDVCRILCLSLYSFASHPPSVLRYQLPPGLKFFQPLPVVELLENDLAHLSSWFQCETSFRGRQILGGICFPSRTIVLVKHCRIFREARQQRSNLDTPWDVSYASSEQCPLGHLDVLSLRLS